MFVSDNLHGHAKFLFASMFSTYGLRSTESVFMEHSMSLGVTLGTQSLFSSTKYTESTERID